MMTRLQAIPFAGSLADKLAGCPGGGMSLYWLGQAGFVIDAGGKRIVIDPYLSDSLAVKYRGTPHPHERMMPAPVTGDALDAIDLVLSTHHHTDHMDGETLSVLAARQPQLRFVVPAASAQIASQRIGVGMERLVMVDAGECLTIEGIGIHVLRAAHESLQRDEQGRHKFLGYGLNLGGLKIFHSGDTVPFDGQDEEIRQFGPDVALLPVNGRAAALAKAGFAGNLTLAEAIELAGRCSIGAVVAHHYGMFAFNTIAPDLIDEAAAHTAIRLLRAKENIEYRVA